MFKGKGSPSVLISKKNGDWARDKTTLAQNLAVISIMPEASMESMVSSFRQVVVVSNSGLAVLAGPHGRGLSPRGRGLSPHGSSPCKSPQSPRKKKTEKLVSPQNAMETLHVEMMECTTFWDQNSHGLRAAIGLRWRWCRWGLAWLHHQTAPLEEICM